MAKFKLFLLTPQKETGEMLYLQNVISEFYTQKERKIDSLKQENSYCFSFDEKLSLHTNAQKELSFSMVRKIWLDDTLIVNPFVSNIQVGTQIMLKDKYDNEMIFTVKNIDYKLGKDNITYNYSCQDSFTYQTIRLNDGYTIDNSPDSPDFIGAKNIDWWVVNKIKPECHLEYEYIPLFKGLYLDKYGVLKTFYNTDKITDVKKIIKEPYLINNYKDYYEEIPFSVSGTTCSAALISLGEEIGMSLNTKEYYKETGEIFRYFWFEPHKKEEVANIKYSPSKSIQSFGLSHAGDSLTTILNVETNMIDDELISIIPSVPLFFRRYILSNDWNKDKNSFTPGMFTSLCQRQIFKIANGDRTNAELDHDMSYAEDAIQNIYKDEEGYLYIKISNQVRTENEKEVKKFLLSPWYNKISFQFEKEKSYVYVSEQKYASNLTDWCFVEKIGDSLTPTYIEYNDSSNLIPTNKLNTLIDAYIRIYVGNDDNNLSLGQSYIILNFYRDYTEEDIEFAEIADQCPWLENKLIDLSYFYQNNIISKNEYNEFLKQIQNDLRVINGKLLLYTEDYYQALQTRTKTVSDLVNVLDALGASFSADVIDFYRRNGSVQEYTSFSNNYKIIEDTYFKNTEPTSLLGYNELLTEIFNKYVNAQQRFLKNIYMFRNFFESPCLYGNNSSLHRHKVTINNNSNNNFYFSFKQYNLNHIDKDFNLYNEKTGEPYVDIYNSTKVEKVDIVHKGNYKNYFTPEIKKGDLIKANKFVVGQEYYRILYKIKKQNIDSELLYESSEWGKISFVKHHEDSDYLYYGFKDTDENIQTIAGGKLWDELTTSKGITLTNKGKELELTLCYENVPINEIISEFLYREAKRNKNIKDRYFYHNTNTDTEVSNNWLKRGDGIGKLINILSPSAWQILLSPKDESDSAWDLIFDFDIDKNNTGYKNLVENLYVLKFPIISVSIQDGKYSKLPFEWQVDSKTYSTSYQRVNENNQTVLQYIDYWKRKSNGEIIDEIKNPTLYTTTYDISLVTPENESNYYRRVVKNPFWGHFWGGVGGAAVGLSGIAGVGGLLSSIGLGVGIYNIVSSEVWMNAETTWLTSGKNTRACDNEQYDTIYSGYVDIRNRDVWNLNYTTSASSYDTYNTLLQERKENDFIVSLEEKADNNGISDTQLPIIKENDGSYSYHNTIMEKSNGKYLINKIPKDPLSFKNYFNYYSMFGFTYSDLVNESDNNDKIKYKETYLRPLKKDDYINPNFTYKMLIQNNGEIDNIVFENINDFSKDNIELKSSDDSNALRFSKIVYYPIANNLIQIDWSVLPNKDNLETLENFLLSSGYYIKDKEDKENEYWFNAQINDKNITFMILQEESFKREKPVTSLTDGLVVDIEKRYSSYDGREIYFHEKPVNFLENPDLVKGFFTLAEKDSAFIQATEAPGDSDAATEDPIYYKKVNGLSQRVYTIKQIKKMSGYYYIGSLSTTFEDLDATPKELIHKVYLHIKQGTNQEVDKEITYEIPELINLVDYVDGKNIKFKETNYKLQVNINSEKICDISGISNGDFWYYYKDKQEWPALQKHAAIIERELTQYWDQAYIASKYCEYFLPESWTPKVYGAKNHFVGDIVKITGTNSDGIISDVHLVLSTLYVPVVNVYSNGNTTRLPSYNIQYGFNNEVLTEDSDIKVINNINLTKESVLSKNIVFKNILDALQEKESNLYVEVPQNVSDYLKRTYYFSSEGGLKWKDLLGTLIYGAPEYKHFDGLYIMQYKILKNCFVDNSFKEYKNLQQQHQSLWDKLYKNYSGLLLESNYSNDKATSSRELFTLANYAFKDKARPEQGYNIALIDVSTLNNYEGQELTIGDSILVDADEYYEDIDLVKKDISQHLFITDISYDLRKDNDIQLTVNHIKYQDKLIQRLVKLIK